MLVVVGLAVISCGTSGGTGSASSHRSVSTRQITGGSTTATTSSPLQTESTNLPIPSAVRSHLRDVLASLRESKVNGEQIGQALPGSVYYARFNGDYYALASFDLPQRGTTDQPSLFAKYGRDPWVYLGNQLGDIATVGALPCPVRNGWSYTCTTPASTAPTPHATFVADVYASCAAIQRQLNTKAGTLSAHPELLAHLRDALGPLAVLRLSATDRPVADRLLTMYAHQIGLLSWIDESHAIGSKRANFNAGVEAQLISNRIGDFLAAHHFPHCFHG